jgi:hypothetical protein
MPRSASIWLASMAWNSSPSPLEEEKLLRVARLFERATNWHTRRPKLAV